MTQNLVDNENGRNETERILSMCSLQGATLNY
jgi:hypothetical protein